MIAAPASRWVDIDGPTHYVDYDGQPDAPLLVCIHGLGGSLINWAAVGPRLASDCRVLALDLVGHGRTKGHGRSAGVNANRVLLDRFLADVAARPAILVGNSMGGMIALLQAAARPGSVAGAVLIDPAIPGPLHRLNPLVALTFVLYGLPRVGETLLAVRRRQFTPEEAFAQVLRACCVDPDRIPPDVIEQGVALSRERAGDQDLEADFLRAARSLLWVLARRRRFEAKMRSIGVPVLVLHGAADRLVPLETVRRAVAQNRSWRLAVAENVGHMPQLEAAPWTAGMILDWLSRDGRDAAERTRLVTPAARHRFV
jgi:pimeloyl-ACP methyl ester carboxylesterase